MNEFSKRLKELRTERKLSQIELAKLMNVTQPTIAKWESGRREPSLDDVLKLADIFNETTDFLLGRKEI